MPRSDFVRQLTAQPQVLITSSRIDWGDSLFRGLKVGAVYNSVGAPPNFADPSNPAGGTPTVNYLSDEGGRYFNITGSYGFDYTNPTTGTQERSFIGLYKRTSAETNNLVFHQGTDGVNGQRVSLRIYTSSALRVDIEGEGYTSSLIPTLDKIVTIGFRFRGTQMQDFDIFCDGIFEACTGTTVTVNTTGTNFSFGYAQGGSGGGSPAAGNLYGGLYWDRWLSDEEFYRLNNNFWSFLSKKAANLYIPTYFPGIFLGGTAVVPIIYRHLRQQGI